MIPSSSPGPFPPDMGAFVLQVPRDRIVLVSWIVSEYDGLGFVRTENARTGEESGGQAIISLFFPPGKKKDVLELLSALETEGIPLQILRVTDPQEPENSAFPEEPDMNSPEDGQIR